MKQFINTSNLSAQRLGEILQKNFPKLYLSIGNGIIVHPDDTDAKLVQIAFESHLVKVDIHQQHENLDEILELIGHSATKSYNNTKLLVAFADKFKEIEGVEIQLETENRASILIDNELACRLLLWTRKNTGEPFEIEMATTTTDGSKKVAEFIENNTSQLYDLVISISGDKIKYISRL